MLARWDLILLAYECWQPCELPPGEIACFTMQNALRNSTRLQAFMRGGGFPDGISCPKVTPICRSNAGGC
jgi:hypothetical protein